MSQFDIRMRNFFANLPEYADNEAALLAGYAIGKPYWSGPRLLKVVAA